MPPSNDPSLHLPLTPHVFQILLSLLDDPRSPVAGEVKS
jgi:hypothetical protein